jgi:L-amino acid N-acyltransferase YncA
MLTLVPALERIDYRLEPFPSPNSPLFNRLFEAHGREVRGKPFDLAYTRYYEIERDKRLVWVVARSIESNAPIGYACGWWYRDMHFDERVGADDLWYVDPNHRRSGVGKTLKVMQHKELAKAGVARIYDVIRGAYNHPTLMHDLGFERWGTRWAKVIS